MACCFLHKTGKRQQDQTPSIQAEFSSFVSLQSATAAQSARNGTWAASTIQFRLGDTSVHLIRPSQTRPDLDSKACLAIAASRVSRSTWMAAARTPAMAPERETIAQSGAMAIPRSAGSDRKKSQKSADHLVSAIAATAIDSRAFGVIVYNQGQPSQMLPPADGAAFTVDPTCRRSVTDARRPPANHLASDARMPIDTSLSPPAMRGNPTVRTGPGPGWVRTRRPHEGRNG